MTSDTTHSGGVSRGSVSSGGVSRGGSHLDREYWDRQAAAFDEQPDHGLRDTATREAWRRLLLGRMPAPPGAVADLGCGTGTLSVLLAEAGYSVTGLDSAPAMIRQARAKARLANVPAQSREARSGAAQSGGARTGTGEPRFVTPRFVTSDAADPALPPGSFNVVLARHVLWAMPDPDAALRAWTGLLRPGGVLVLIEGRWETGAGIPAAAAADAVRRLRAQADVTPLRDPLLWGGPISDERYLLVSER